MDIFKTKKSSRHCHNQLTASTKLLAKGTNEKDVYGLEFDGASKGNPGKAGAGAILKRPDGTVLCQLTKGVGIATCNFAEYRALIMGLQAAVDQGIHHIKAQGDSKLVCNQVMGKWKVRSENLSTSFAETLELKERFQSFSIKHVYRESNSAADALANSAVLLPEDEPVSCCSSSPGQQTATTKSGRPRKSSAQKHKSVEDPCNAREACKLIKLSHISEEDKKKFYRMNYHGASSRKHGEASARALLYTPNGSLCSEIKKGLGVATGNVSHYLALVIGLRAALEHNVSHIIVQGDALLIFKQMTGQVKIKEERLVALWKEANSLLTRFTKVAVTHVDKCQNPAAFALTEQAVDSGNENFKDASKTSGKSGMGSCMAVCSQNSSSKMMTLYEIARPLGPLSTAKINVLVAVHSRQAYKPYRCFPHTLYSQTSQVLRMRHAHPLPFTAIMSKCLPPLYATSIHKVALLLPAKKVRCIPHLLHSSLKHVAGGMHNLNGL